MRRLPDILIAIGVIAGVIALTTGLRVVGAASLLVAFIVGWKRNWCICTVEELFQSCEDRSQSADAAGTTTDAPHSDTPDPD